MSTSYSESDLRNRLSSEQFAVTQEAATEPPFTGELLHNKADGVYRCIVCGEPLFLSDTKFDSGSGWPSFTDPASRDAVTEHVDRSHGMTRTETTCNNCGAHLGHVFPDGPGDSGLRYCINSASLAFDPADSDE
ncbi:MAG: peptide-methionine (R)-S-oxide reductase MsrB [Acidimicrobiia bacterium]|nr:peptide-methionine (R)-S-oxide reductase MsrB [Acidimicrobiia bacterium]